MEIKEIRKLTLLSQKEFAEKYNIPIYTLKKWELDASDPNHRNCPEYVKQLLEKAVRTDSSISEFVLIF